MVKAVSCRDEDVANEVNFPCTMIEFGVQHCSVDNPYLYPC